MLESPRPPRPTPPPELAPTRSPSIYIHVPFCVTKCSYCDFYSIPGALDQAGVFLDALEREMDARLPATRIAPPTVFLGGGTPTQLDPRELRRLLTLVRSRIDPACLVELTVEANPGTLTPEKVALLRELGVTRLSLGAQSFHPEQLAFLERIHGPDDTVEAARVARAGGLDDFNLDLIYAIPGQTLESFCNDLQRAASLEPTHISAYSLTYEEGTPLGARYAKGLVTPPDEESQRRFFETALRELERHGYPRYEISNFARPGRACRHNLNYWDGGEYYGFGPGAHSHLAGCRAGNHRDLRRYVADLRAGRPPVAFTETLAPDERLGEAMMLGLRTVFGVSRRRLADRFSLDIEARFGSTVARHVAAGLARYDGDRLRLTDEGFLFADSIVADYLSVEATEANKL